MREKIESTCNIQKIVTVISLENWKEILKHRFNLLCQLLISIDLNKFLQLHMAVSFVKYSHHLLTLSLLYLLLKYIRKYKNVLSKR